MYECPAPLRPLTTNYSPYSSTWHLYIATRNGAGGYLRKTARPVNTTRENGMNDHDMGKRKSKKGKEI
jgi:hypothetical protein